jgi:hypothetical protein
MVSVVVVTEFVSPRENSTGYFWFSLINEFVEKFEDVVVISSSENRFSNGVDFVAVTARFYDKGSLLRRIFSQVEQSFKFCYFISRVKHKNYTLVTGTNPPLMLLILPILKKIIGFKWALLVHDVFPENLVPAGFVREGGLGYRLLVNFFSVIYASPDQLVVIGNDMKELFEKKSGFNGGRLSVIQNWVNYKEVMPMAKEQTALLFLGIWGACKV